MSLMDRPSPAPRMIDAATVRRAARSTAQREAHLAQVPAHALAAGHPCAPYDYEAERIEVTVLVALSLKDALRLRTECETSPHAWKQAIGATLRRQMSERADWTPADGIPRGTA